MARDFGTVSELFPPGITSVRDLPWRWFDAISQAMFFLSFDELEKGEKPPKEIWLDPDKLTAHFERVEKMRKEKWGGDGTNTVEIEDPVENQAAGDLLVG